MTIMVGIEVNATRIALISSGRRFGYSIRCVRTGGSGAGVVTERSS
jgi:hypothetical protein